MNPQRYLDLLEQFRSRRIGVIGDFLLDQYIIGHSARVSREAPIVVVDYQDTVYHPGGAANAAQNVTALGGSAHAVGVEPLSPRVASSTVPSRRRTRRLPAPDR